MSREEFKSLFLEFARYILVGGSAFVIDFAIMSIFNEYIFKGHYIWASVFIGYMVGLIYNFLLSCGYVYKDGFAKIKDKELSSFIIFTIIGLIGLLMTEGLMILFVHKLNLYYMFAKIITAAIVMFWNYIARKIILF